MSRFDDARVILVTDCGSTTTKALLFEKLNDGWKHTYRGESPTTVEKPVADVTVGVRRAIGELEDLSGRKFLKRDGGGVLVRSEGGDEGVDLYLSTSSAGGGLQMIVYGVSNRLSAKAAETAALGAGAIVLATLSAEDGREDVDRINALRTLKPDIVLVAGGTEGGAKEFPLGIAEWIVAANPAPRFGDSYSLPIIFSGNSQIRDELSKLLGAKFEIHFVENIMPEIGVSVIHPTRKVVHDLFLSHVMSHSPGYSTLLGWTSKPIIPTPTAVGLIVEAFARRSKASVLCLDIGGATTDVFSVERGENAIFQRSVSANLGMSYSIGNVLLESGIGNIKRWLPFEISDSELKNSIRNKMIRPTTIPEDNRELLIEHAVCREALRLSVDHHKKLLESFSYDSQSKQKGISSIFSQGARGDHFRIEEIDLVVGSGGVLSHAPRRIQAALALIEGLGVAGITEIAIDSVFMAPHLGVISQSSTDIALEIFERDCLELVCVCLSPISTIRNAKGEPLAKVFVNGELVGEMLGGEVSRLSIKGVAELKVRPINKRVDFGAGAGEEMTRTVNFGSEGLILYGAEIGGRCRASIDQRKALVKDLKAYGEE